MAAVLAAAGVAILVPLDERKPSLYESSIPSARAD